MKFRILMLTMALALFTVACNESGEPGADTENETQMAKPAEQLEKVSYSIGLDLGNNFRRDSIGVNIDYFLQGLRDGLNEKDPLLTKEEVDSTMKSFQEEIYAKQQSQQEQQMEGWRTKSENFKNNYQKFLDDNKKKSGVKVSSSGLQYKILEEGKGASPDDNDVAKVHFKAELLDGTEFDNTYSRNQPIELPVRAVVPGWSEALKMLKPGGKAQFWIPPSLAYGEEGMPPQIPGYSVLIFEIELLEVKEDAGNQMMQGMQPQMQQQPRP